MRLALLVMLICLPTFAQDVKSFKANRLDMPLEEFKQINSGQKVWINTGDPLKKLNKKLSRQVDTPLCTDSMDGFEGSDSRLPGETLCNISPGGMNPQAKILAGIEMKQILYHFNSGQLNQIQIQFATVNYAAVRSAFVAKYGSPTATIKNSCQNAFGAAWSSESAKWAVPPSVSAILVEGCGNGPGQNAFDDISGGSIYDDSITPKSQPVQRAAEF